MSSDPRTPDPMEIWDANKITDETNEFGKPTTKHVNQRGGFTAIDAQYQIHRATRFWGPIGRAWGLKGDTYGYVRNAAGEPIELWYEAVFWYEGGEFPISSDIAYRVGNESRKKVRTDSLTKALSQLGFSADVFMGAFDGNRYDAPRAPQQRQAPRQQQNGGGGQAPPGRDDANGAGGRQQTCEQCGSRGRTMQYWKPGGRMPDLECTGQCTETWNDKARPRRWWSVTKDNGPAPAQQQNDPPPDAYDGIPFS